MHRRTSIAAGAAAVAASALQIAWLAARGDDPDPMVDALVALGGTLLVATLTAAAVVALLPLGRTDRALGVTTAGTCAVATAAWIAPLYLDDDPPLSVSLAPAASAVAVAALLVAATCAALLAWRLLRSGGIRGPLRAPVTAGLVLAAVPALCLETIQPLALWAAAVGAPAAALLAGRLRGRARRSGRGRRVLAG